MCEVKHRQDYTLAAEKEIGMGDNGGKRFLEEASLLTKIMAGVITILIVSGLAFGVKVYAFMEEGGRFSSEDYLREENRQDILTHAEYMPRDVYNANQLRAEEHRVRIQAKLDEMDEKLDMLLGVHGRSP